MTVSIFAPNRPELAMTLNQQNFHWLMTVLGLSYNAESVAMAPADVVAAIANFRQEYCYRHYDEASRAAKVAAWRGILQAKRSPAPIMQAVVDELGGNIIAAEPNWSDLGDPFIPGSEAYQLQEQLSGYLQRLGSMARYCVRTKQPIHLA